MQGRSRKYALDGIVRVLVLWAMISADIIPADGNRPLVGHNTMTKAQPGLASRRLARFLRITGFCTSSAAECRRMSLNAYSNKGAGIYTAGRYS
jgi:hypothetical protein